MSVAHQSAEDIRIEIEQMLDDISLSLENEGFSTDIETVDRIRVAVDRLASRAEREGENRMRMLYEGADGH